MSRTIFAEVETVIIALHPRYGLAICRLAARAIVGVANISVANGGARPLYTPWSMRAMLELCQTGNNESRTGLASLVSAMSPGRAAANFGNAAPMLLRCSPPAFAPLS